MYRRNLRTIEEVIESRSIPEPMSGCLLWTGQIEAHGYGVVRYKGKRYYAHRLSKLGLSDNKLCVLHKCDNTACVNPKHLYLGTKLDNAQDRVIRKREGDRRGSLNGRAKLNKGLVLNMRNMYTQGFNYKDLAAVFSVHVSTVDRVIRNKAWVEVEETCSGAYAVCRV